MIKIVLCCSVAMSTSLLAEKMKRAAHERNLDVEIWASSVNDIEISAKNADIVLIAPQVKYAKKQIQKKLNQIPVVDISMRDYGMMNGKNVFDEVLNIINMKE